MKLIVSCWHAAETICKYLRKVSGSNQGQSVDKWCWLLTNIETKVVAQPMFPKPNQVVFVPEVNQSVVSC